MKRHRAGKSQVPDLPGGAGGDGRHAQDARVAHAVAGGDVGLGLQREHADLPDVAVRVADPDVLGARAGRRPRPRRRPRGPWSSQGGGGACELQAGARLADGD